MSIDGMSTSAGHGYGCLRADCGNCFGFCCVALYFSALDGFPVDKAADEPCINLLPDFRCRVYGSLRQQGLKGCTAYDCFGAGQKVAQVTYRGRDWRQFPDISKQMFEVFLIMKQLHEMLWYLEEAYRRQMNIEIKDKIKNIINETERLTSLNAEALLKLDIPAHREAVNALLRNTSDMLRNKAGRKGKTQLRRRMIPGRGLDLIGADLRKKDLRSENLSGACLIAADLRGADLAFTDFIGADLRDADVSGADLSESIFITQAQINSAKGDSCTKLPETLVRPEHWEDN